MLKKDRWAEGRAASAKVLTGKADAFAEDMRVELILHAGVSATETAKKLNKAGVPGPRGEAGTWTARAVLNVEARIAALDTERAKAAKEAALAVPEEERILRQLEADDKQEAESYVRRVVHGQAGAYREPRADYAKQEDLRQQAKDLLWERTVGAVRRAEYAGGPEEYDAMRKAFLGVHAGREGGFAPYVRINATAEGVLWGLEAIARGITVEELQQRRADQAAKAKVQEETRKRKAREKAEEYARLTNTPEKYKQYWKDINAAKKASKDEELRAIVEMTEAEWEAEFDRLSGLAHTRNPGWKKAGKRLGLFRQSITERRKKEQVHASTQAAAKETLP